MKNQTIFNEIDAFQMDISYSELKPDSPLNTNNHHIHDECEIYVNLSGDVSFAVENSFYPIMPGSIIITRPFEYHHCIYHSDKLHRHYWILLQSTQNKNLFDIFYNRECGKNNLIILDAQKNKELLQICQKLNEGVENDIDKYFYFFKMLHLLSSSSALNAPNNGDNENIIAPALNYINSNFHQKISVNELAQSCHISISSLERYFFNAFNMTPSEYVKKRRLANATKMLSEGYSVTDAAYHSGFSDCSSFVASFKKEYNITPLQYKKRKTKEL